jgi:3-hydroxy-3-methylglutaryl CoA synthase
LSRQSIAAAMGWLVPSLKETASGHRTLAFWDEDSTTMAVEAARSCLSRVVSTDAATHIAALAFATNSPAFAEGRNAGIIHRALRLPDGCSAQEMAGTPRAGLLALQQALQDSRTSLVVAADRPINPSGSTAEMQWADGAAAALVSDDPPLLAYLGGGNVTAAFIDRYRRTGERFATTWEERWIREEGYLKIVPAAIKAALTEAAIGAGQIDWLVLPCVIPGVPAAVARKAGLAQARVADPLSQSCGDIGAGHALVMLAQSLETMRPGERVLVVQFGQGATALVFEVTEQVADWTPLVSVQLEAGREEQNYLKLPIFTGLLPWEKGLRGRASVNEALTVAYRQQDAMLGFVGGRSRTSGTVQFPPSRLSESAMMPELDTQDPWPLSERGGRIVTRVADSLAFSRHPPNCYGLVDFHGGGRLMMEFSDPDAAELEIGDDVRFVFRIKDTDDRTGFMRYFWKAVPTRLPDPVSKDNGMER